MTLFDGASAANLRALATSLKSGQLGVPLSKFAISKIATCSNAVVAELCRLSAEAISPSHLALLLDTAADAAEARMTGMSCELVWTGPEAMVSHSRDTAVVVEALFHEAERRVLVSSFALHQGSSVFLPLATRMDRRPDLDVRLFLHIGRDWNDTRDESEILREFAASLGQEWPWSKRPDVYYDPRALSADRATRAAWHAKCVLVDDELAFVTSANFTEWAQQRNVEAGVLVRSRHFAGQLRAQFDGLVQAKLVRRLPGF